MDRQKLLCGSMERFFVIIQIWNVTLDDHCMVQNNQKYINLDCIGRPKSAQEVNYLGWTQKMSRWAQYRFPNGARHTWFQLLFYIQIHKRQFLAAPMFYIIIGHLWTVFSLQAFISLVNKKLLSVCYLRKNTWNIPIEVC